VSQLKQADYGPGDLRLWAADCPALDSRLALMAVKKNCLQFEVVFSRSKVVIFIFTSRLNIKLKYHSANLLLLCSHVSVHEEGRIFKEP
jgi:hypothetical protein